jgi:hypothetical protein
MSQSNDQSRRLRLVDEPKRPVRYTFGFGIPDGPTGPVASVGPLLGGEIKGPSVAKVAVGYLTRVEAAIAGNPQLKADTIYLIARAREAARRL